MRSKGIRSYPYVQHEKRLTVCRIPSYAYDGGYIGGNIGGTIRGEIGDDVGGHIIYDRPAIT